MSRSACGPVSMPSVTQVSSPNSRTPSIMAETASILCPEKTVLIPDLDAGCSLAASIDVAQLAAWKADYPEGVVVMYVNTTAAVKATLSAIAAPTVPRRNRLLESASFNRA